MVDLCSVFNLREICPTEFSVVSGLDQVIMVLTELGFFTADLHSWARPAAPASLRPERPDLPFLGLDLFTTYFQKGQRFLA